MKDRDEILQLPLHLSAYIIEGKLKILETNQKSEEIKHFYDFIPCFVHLRAFTAIS